MKKIIWTGLLTGVAMLATNVAFNLLMNILMPSLKEAYVNEAFRPWSDPIMSLFFLYPIVLGFGFAFVWDKTKKLFNKGVFMNGVNFGLIYLFVNELPAFLINYSSFTFPISMILGWILMGILNGFVAGFILAGLNKK